MRKNFSKIISVLSVIVLIASMFVLGSSYYVDEYLKTAQYIAEELFKQLEQTEEISYVDVRYLKGLDGQEDYILTEREGQGYAIFEKEDMNLIEFSVNDKSPYFDVEQSQIYYAGPSNYFRYENNDFYNLNTNKKVKDKYFKDIAKNIKKELKKQKQNKTNKKNNQTDVEGETVLLANQINVDNTQLEEENTEDGIGESNSTTINYDEKIIEKYNVVGSSYIDGYQYFINNSEHGENLDAECVSVATQLLLGFNNWRNDGRLIPANPSATEKFLPDLTIEDRSKVYSKEMKSTTSEVDDDGITTFYEKLVNVLGSWTSYTKLQTELNNYIDNYSPNLKNNISHGYCVKDNNTNFYTFIDNELLNNRPLILSINTYDENNVKTRHAITAYGKATVRYQGVEIDGYISHFGWGYSCSNIWISKDWVLEYYFFNINHSHNDVDYYNYPHAKICSICNRTRIEGAHTFGNPLSIESSVNEDKLASINTNRHHYRECNCGFLLKELHCCDIYVNYDIDYHFSKCECGYGGTKDTRVLVPHLFKGGAKNCFFCGAPNPNC